MSITVASVTLASAVSDLISLMAVDKIVAAQIRQAAGKLERVHAGELTIEQARELSRTEGPDALDRYLADTE